MCSELARREEEERVRLAKEIGIHAFAFGKGNMMAEVHRHLVEHLEWNGEGTLLDIGCGAAALTVRCAKAFPKAQITAMDYWGAEWNYAKEQWGKICSRRKRYMAIWMHL